MLVDIVNSWLLRVSGGIRQIGIPREGHSIQILLIEAEYLAGLRKYQLGIPIYVFVYSSQLYVY